VSGQRSDQPAPDPIDTSVTHPARRYNYFLGGTTNFAADRESGDRMLAAMPAVRVGALENRRFLRRAVTHLAAQAGIRQFLDIGAGIPTSPNVHEVAQTIAPDARAVYVDNDPIVLAHSRALLTSAPEGATAYLDADLHQPDRILAHPDLRHTLDLSRPTALLLVAVLHFVPDTDSPLDLLAPLLDALAPGSYLVMSHGTYDFLPRETVDRLDRVVSAEAIHTRSKAQFAAFFDGLELVEPGIVPTSQWRAEDEPPPRPTPAEVGCYAAVARVR
jgi:SAM-dependent methyltransferase